MVQVQVSIQAQRNDELTPSSMRILTLASLVYGQVEEEEAQVL